MSTLLTVLKEFDEILEERDALRERVKQLEAKTSDNKRKLSKSEVSSIRGMRRAGFKLQEIADTFDINQATVSRIVRGEYHK